MAKKRYSVVGVVTGSKWLGEFEAESSEEAERMALESDLAHISLCHQCSRHVEDPEITDATAEPVE